MATMSIASDITGGTHIADDHPTSPTPPTITPTIKDPYNAAKICILSCTLYVDIVYSTFVTPYLPALLLDAGYTTSDISELLSSYWLASLFGYACAVIYANLPIKRHTPGHTASNTTYAQWRFITVATVIVVIAGLIPCITPAYGAILSSRIIQGFLSAFFWSYSLSLAAQLQPVYRVNAAALALAGSSLGELTGPLLGTALWSLYPSVRFTYAVVCVIAAVVALGSLYVFRQVQQAHHHQLQHPQHIDSRTSDDAVNVMTITDTNQAVVFNQYMSHSNNNTAARHANIAARILQSVATVFRLMCRPFMIQFASVLLLNGMIRTALDTVIPLYLIATIDGTAVQIGALFGCAAGAYVLASVATGRLVLSVRKPAVLVATVQIVVAGVACLMLYTYSYPAVVLCVASLCACFAIQSVLCCDQLEQCSNHMTVHDANVYKQVAADDDHAYESTQIMSTAMCLWTVGYAAGGQLAGAGNTVQSMQFVLIALGVCNGFYCLVYGAAFAVRYVSERRAMKQSIEMIAHTVG